MKATELFKTKAEVSAALDKLNVEYKKIMSGVNEGKATQTFDELCNLYDESQVEVVEEKPFFKAPAKRFNPMTFRFQ